MHNLIPHFIQDQYQQGHQRGQFDAVGLFLDISGFTTTTDILMKHGPHGAEVLATMMRAIFEPLANGVFAQGGFIATTAGDAFTALFPLETSSPYHRALAAAFEAQQQMIAGSRQNTPYGTFEIQAKIGLAVGEVHWGIVTSQDGRRATYYFQGSAVDRCAQAEHQAQPGEIVLDASLLPHLGDTVVVEPVADCFCIRRLSGPLPPPQLIEQPVSDPAISALFYPESLIHQAHSGEFRPVVNMFINLPTIRTESQLNIFMRFLFELQEHYGGLLKTLDFGDKGSNLLLFWGAPVAYENDIERALNFILALQPLTSIPINAGITYQIAHAGFIGSPLFEEYTCFGRGVNLAARFMVAAPRGEIWVDAQIARRAQTLYDLELVGEMNFKGFERQMAVYTLYERKEEIDAIHQSKMVGRAEELAQMESFCTPLWQGRYCGAFVISGEPGIGKSRLVQAWRDRISNDHKQAFWAYCQADTTLRESLNPFRYWLRRYLGQTEGFTEGRNKRSFNLKLDGLIEFTRSIDPALSEELDRTRSFLGALVGLYWSDSLFEQLDSQGRYENTQISLITLLRAESLRQPVIVFIEDAHGLDDDSRAVLPRLDRAVTSDPSRSYPIALLAAARSGAVEPLLGAGLNYQMLALTGISVTEMPHLAEYILGGPASPTLLRQLVERTDGNPFFAEQILRYLQEEQALRLEGDGWNTTENAEQPPLPTDVRAVLAARLDRLGQAVKGVVQTAAILGREFDVQLLARMLKSDESLFQKMRLAADASIWIALNELRYLFKHALLQDAAYRMLVRTHRQALHVAAVSAMESIYAADLSSHYTELAYHSEQAGLRQKAAHYYQLGGDVAREAFQNSQAADAYTKALSHIDESDQETRFRLLLARESINGLLGRREAQRRDLETLSRLLDDLDSGRDSTHMTAHPAEVAARWADYTLETGHLSEAAQAAEKAVSLALHTNALEVSPRAYATWSSALYRQGKFESASAIAGEGYRIAQKNGNKHGQGLTLNLLGLIAMEQKDSVTIRRYLKESLTVAQETRNRRQQIRSQNNLGNLAGASGDFILASQHYQEALRLGREIGDRAAEGLVLGNLGWVNGSLGDYASARSYSEQNLRIAREIGEPMVEAYVMINLSSYAGRQGDYPAATTFAEQSLSMARQTGDPSCEAWALTYLGHALLATGQFETAKTNYQGALQIRRSLGQPHLACEPLAGLAQVALAWSDLSDARIHTEAIMTYLNQGGTLDGTDEPLQVYLTCYQVLKALNNPAAGEILATAYNILQERASRISDPDRRRSYLENVPYHRQVLAARLGEIGT